MREKRAAPTKRITEEIKRKCKQSNEGTGFVSVDESKRRVHVVLKCESFGTVWNRDVNNALDGIFVYRSKHDNESPPPSKD
ncbi:hypothetical protein AB4K20DRAFT_1944693 [Rhizopus microsporus]|uniref:Uncharacterized protein n=1 Tax=Rhizopus microsporus TaxID=58291 RepID=A0A1X0RYE2_RHIZD|nr:hypothetical protein BCV71DRAFT_265118 [Rhizopus microsporus]